MKNREIQPCIRCGRGLKAPGGITVTGDRAIAVYQEVVTVGLRPRLRSKKRRSVFCVPCGVSLALGPRPESGAFASEIYEMLRDIVSQDPSLVAAALRSPGGSSCTDATIGGISPGQNSRRPRTENARASGGLLEKRMRPLRRIRFFCPALTYHGARTQAAERGRSASIHR